MTLSTNVPVVPPESWGVYTVPKQPNAGEPVDVLIRSAAYFDPKTMKVSVNANVIRVDFDYLASAPAQGATPAGMTTFASVRVGSLAPGNYHVEAWGRPNTGGTSERYFTRDFATDTQVGVVEFYHPSLDHYFMTANADEIAALDAGGYGGGWKRTGQSFKGWGNANDAPPNARPVCRFYAAGPNSHFYTGSADDCSWLKNLEQSGRAEANAQGKAFLGWAFESIAFYALLPQGDQCAAGSLPVFRAYNNRFAQNDSNHRFTIDPAMRYAMQMGWLDEGAVFCSPS
jgi:serine protease